MCFWQIVGLECCSSDGPSNIWGKKMFLQYFLLDQLYNFARCWISWSALYTLLIVQVTTLQDKLPCPKGCLEASPTLVSLVEHHYSLHRIEMVSTYGRNLKLRDLFCWSLNSQAQKAVLATFMYICLIKIFNSLPIININHFQNRQLLWDIDFKQDFNIMYFIRIRKRERELYF